MVRMLTESPAAGAAGSGRAVPRRQRVRTLSALGACALLSGCGGTYLLQAAAGQWRVLHARVPIDTVLAAPRTPPELRARLTTVRAAREFAWRELGLSLEAQGFDVALDGVPAYSTLGKFADPVLSSMLRYGDDQLAATIFH